ncbi:MAG: Crp/Fnr family transcriptional regulator [Salibacteraceae bacterium]
MDQLKTELPFLSEGLTDEVVNSSTIQTFPPGLEILREGQYVKVVPLVIEGLIKVYTRHNDKELLLYYIQPKESCIMSFSASLKNEKSRVFAVTEEETRALLIPVDKIPNWIKEYPELNNLFYQQYNTRYTDLLDTIHHVLFDKMDVRLFDYLTNRVKLTDQNPLKISHRVIASELGTAREVISRTIKKLELEGKVIQHSNQIEVIW